MFQLRAEVVIAILLLIGVMFLVGMFICLEWTLWGLVLVLLSMSLYIGIYFLYSFSQKEENGKKGKSLWIFRLEQVPRMRYLVMRNVWGSNKETLEGFAVLKPGWVFYIQNWWWYREGEVEMEPYPWDPQELKVNSTDMLELSSDVQVSTQVRRDDDRAAIRFLLNARGAEDQAKRQEELSKQYLHAALNYVTSDSDKYRVFERKPEDDSCAALQLAGSKKPKLDAMSRDASEILTKSLEPFGLEATVKIQVFNLPEVLARAQRARAAAEPEVEEMQREGKAIANVLQSITSAVAGAEIDVNSFLQPPVIQQLLQQPGGAEQLAKIVKNIKGGVDPTIIAGILTTATFGRAFWEQLFGGRSKKSESKRGEKEQKEGGKE